jgi:diguanylate cyclase (GGDEF)-like protein
MLPLASLAKRNRHHIGVLMIDIDDFKQVNDRHGHQSGDELLQTIATLIRGQLRKSDLIARYGGEEFLVFLPSVKPYAAADVAEGIRKQVAEGMAEPPRVTVSVGVAVGRIEGPVEEAVQALIRTADERLLSAKAAGKNRIVAE